MSANSTLVGVTSPKFTRIRYTLKLVTGVSPPGSWRAVAQTIEAVYAWG